MSRADILVNPTSGSSAKARGLRRFVHLLEQAGFEVVVRPTTHAGHAPELVRAAVGDGADVIVAAGGDGTLNEVAGGLLACGAGAPPLALLPRGTSNLVARELGVPFAPDGAARVVAERAERLLDVVRIGDGAGGDRTMVACAGVGWDAHVVRELAAARRGHITVRSWLRPIASALRNYTFPVFRVTPDDGPPVEGVLALFLNCRPYATFFRPAPDARPDDGLLDAVIVGPEGRRHLPRIAWRAWRQTLAADPAVTTVRAARFRVEGDGPVPVQIDGDVGGWAPVDMLVRPGALRILVPRTPAGDRS